MKPSLLFTDLAHRLDGARHHVSRHPPAGDAAETQNMVDAIDCARVVMLQLARLSRDETGLTTPEHHPTT